MSDTDALRESIRKAFFNFSDRFSRLTSGKFSGMVLDKGEDGLGPLMVLTPSGSVRFEGVWGDVFDAKPLSNEEVEALGLLNKS